MDMLVYYRECKNSKCLLRTASINGCLTLEAKEQDKFYRRPMEQPWPAEEQDNTIWQDMHDGGIGNKAIIICNLTRKNTA